VRARHPRARPWPTRVLTLAALTAVAIAGTAVVSSPASAAWVPKTPRLATPWTSQVPVNTPPLPEYPRPQLTRPDWQNLNGIWDFVVTGNTVTTPPTNWGTEQIRVPFPVESALSGIMRTVTPSQKVWYRRTFTVPAAWNGRRIQLNFGGVDWQTTVWVNGQQVGTPHTGAFDSFRYDITPLLNGGTNTVVASVYSSNGSPEPRGKQTLNPGGIFYTAATGIWQTVWLEPTPTAHITRLHITPNLPTGQLRVVTFGAGVNGHNANVIVSTGGTVVGSASGNVGATVAVTIPNPRLWTPEDPFLYDIRVELRTGTTVVDSVGSYHGMRSIGMASVNGVLRPVLNGSFVFQMGTLDQGYWPDGILTAPTDAALRFDLEAHKTMGFNTVRKHVKVEPARWYYHADRLGLLVWQDMPNGDSNAAGQQAHESEMRRMIDQFRSFTSIIMWVVFNEGWGEYDPAGQTNIVKGLDPSRLANNNSGSNCCGFDGGNGDVIDDHNYPGPGVINLPTATRGAVLGEYGGIGKNIPGHTWSPVTGDTVNVTVDYLNRLAMIRNKMIYTGLSAAIYTQITDVEDERNGLYTYDRAILKVDPNQLRVAQQALINESRSVPPKTTLPVNSAVSLRVTNAGLTDRYLRHQQSVVRTDPVTAASDPLLKNDATFWIRTGLANNSCYSFESRNFAGHYLRHAQFRLRKDPNDNTALFRNDATFCPEPGSGGVRLHSYNIPGYIRHIGAEVYVATNGGPGTWDNPSSFVQDTIWAVAAPWAP
jgi:hypothetical protein